MTEAVHESHDQNWELRKEETEIWENIRIFILETKILVLQTQTLHFHFLSHTLNLAIKTIAFLPFRNYIKFYVIITSMIALSCGSEFLP